MNTNTKRLVESAIMVAIGTLLSVLSFQGPWALGGSITVCSMLPLVFIAQRYGTKWGVFTAFVFSLLQLVLGVHNVQYATSFIMAVGIVMLDYVLAFTIVGFSAVFNKLISNRLVAIITGIIVTFVGRFVCHFLSGWIIWEALWPNELGWAPALWSFVYNGSYMLPEIIITVVAAALLYKPLNKYWLGEDLKK